MWILLIEIGLTVLALILYRAARMSLLVPLLLLVSLIWFSVACPTSGGLINMARSNPTWVDWLIFGALALAIAYAILVLIRERAQHK